MKGRLKFEDVGGRATTIGLNGLDPADTNVMTKLNALATTLRTYTNCAITEYGVTVPQITDITGENPTTGVYDSSMQKGIIRFSYSENNENKSIALYIPAPNVAGYVWVDEVGYRVEEGTADAIRAALVTATGKTGLVVESGVIEYIDGKSTRPTDGAYIKFKDDFDRVQYMGVPEVDDLAKLAAFSAALFQGSSAYTNAAPVQIGVMTPSIAYRSTDTPDTESGYDTVEWRGVFKFSYLTSANKRKIMSFTLPGLKDSLIFGVGNKKDLYIEKATGDAIGVALATLYGSGNRQCHYESCKIDKVNLKV